MNENGGFFTLGITMGVIICIGVFTAGNISQTVFEMIGNKLYVKWEGNRDWEKAGYYEVDISKKYNFKNHVMVVESDKK